MKLNYELDLDLLKETIAYEANRHIEVWEDGVHSTEIVQRLDF